MILDAVEPSGRFLNEARTQLTLVDPRLRTTRFELERTAPGRYATRIPVPDSGAYELLLDQTRDNQPIGRQTRGLAVGYPDELRLRPADRDTLARLAASTGGRAQIQPQDAFRPPQNSTPRATPLWPALLVLSLLLFVADVALRRVDLPGVRFLNSSLSPRRV